MSASQSDSHVFGSCSEMCPKIEQNLRQRERLLHPIEVLEGTEHFLVPLADPKKSVKSFSRSAAGRRSQSPSNLRPLSILEETVKYLLKLVQFDRSKDWTSIYDFIFDRLRAVHQDAIIQGLTSLEAVHIFESIARFLVYSGYRLCSQITPNYNAVINGNHLQEFLKKILRIYDDYSQEHSMSVGSRPQFEALYVIHNLGDSSALQRGISLEKLWRTKDVKTAMEMSIAVWHGHYIQALSLMKALPMLLSCAAALQIPKIRRKAFQVMSYAYSSKNICYPMEDLQNSLHYSSDRLLIDDCKHYNVIHHTEGIQFLKGTFNKTADLVSPRPLEHLDKLLESSDIPQVLLTGKEV